MPPVHVQVFLGPERLPAALESALAAVPCWTSFRSLDALEPPAPSADVCVAVLARDDARQRAALDRLLGHAAAQRRATLVVQPAGGRAESVANRADLPVLFDSSENETILATQLRALIALRPSFRTPETPARPGAEPTDDRFGRRMLAQLRMAGRLQQEFLPARLPRTDAFEFTALFRPLDYVSGDVYNVQSIGDDHIAFAVADATGHGIPAALLTVFIQRVLRGRAHRELRCPAAMLRSLNEEIFDANLAHCRFVAATCGVLNTRTRELLLARGGSPYPLLRRASGRTTLLRTPGTVIGVLPEADFAVETVLLEPGDALLLYSDGLEALALPHSPDAQALAHAVAPNIARRSAAATPEELAEWEDAASSPSGGRAAAAAVVAAPPRPRTRPRFATGGGLPRVRGAMRTTPAAVVPAPATSCPPDELIRETPWFALLEERGARRWLAEINEHYDLLRRMGQPLDDVTVLALLMAD